ncbi:redoxin domain-containing protein [Mucilaginibacter robiniae]|uniref:Redoxin domain-containing protein n=1 Tax=Mucilaginibacter robiniae TaxID=2728022 RepID=A0A7L5E0T1_9SPHI|nr:TlpA disulfide reductase family protein [Mucilaginibacter robiniae]QJD95977.1 redoxin domain-containing protein [Mucilaginibacter robiniae]
MKHKIRFPGPLWPLRKLNDPAPFSLQPASQHRYGIALLILWLLVYLFTALRANAQSAEGLTVGQPVPEIQLRLILNNPSRITRLSDLKGRLVILDFWATWCGGCLAALPKMEALQQKFGNQLQILAVTYEPRAKIEHFFRTRTDDHGRKYHFPTVVEDTVLSRLFPHRFIPHLVWITPDGRVQEITGTEDVNAAGISAALHRQSLQVATKVDMDAERPLFASPQLVLDSSSFYSVFVKGHYPGLGSGTRFRQQDTLVYGRAFTNAYLQEILVNVAYGLFAQQHDVYSTKRLVLWLSHAHRFIRPKKADGSWDTAEEYNYEFRVPLVRRDSLYSDMLSDLNRYSGFEARMEPRLTDCLVLVRTDSTDRMRSRGGPVVNTAFTQHSQFQNCPLRYLVNDMNDDLLTFPQPVLDETGYTGNVDLLVSTRPDLPTLNRELAAYGLQLRPARRRISLFVITEKTPLHP